MEFIKDDGGRAEAGKRGTSRDCAIRAVAIGTKRPYAEVYEAMNTRQLLVHGESVARGTWPDVTDWFLTQVCGWRRGKNKLGSVIEPGMFPEAIIELNRPSHVVFVLGTAYFDSWESMTKPRRVAKWWSPVLDRV